MNAMKNVIHLLRQLDVLKGMFRHYTALSIIANVIMHYVHQKKMNIHRKKNVKSTVSRALFQQSGQNAATTIKLVAGIVCPIRS